MVRAHQLAGHTLGELAARAGLVVPRDTRHAKGWIGRLAEELLGADAASRSVPDFTALGVELKTLPIDPVGRPRESTFVCLIPLGALRAATWSTSHVRRKLARVLWVPVVTPRGAPLADRVVATPLLWRCAGADESALREDWEELVDLIRLGQIDAIGGELGTCLQVRPKAANARARRQGVGEDGWPIDVLPRGFYLRATFTGALLRRHFIMPR